MKQPLGQADHYDVILDEYERHYYDESSLAYRERYIYPTLFAGIDLSNRRVIELACGSGFNTQALLRRFPAAEPLGLDISPRSCEAYRRNTGRPAQVFDLTDPSPVDLPEPADCSFVVGGLHHCVRDLPSTFANLRRLIRLGGHLLLVEPNADFVLNALRMAWYRRDRWFQAQDEAPLDHDLLLSEASGFEAEFVSFLGGPAYFLIANSLVMRMPLAFKRPLAPALFAVDDLYNRLPGRRPYPMFIARWRRVTSPGESAV